MENKNIRIMIVDNSQDSRTILVEILRKNGIEIAGEADSLENAVSVYNNCKPDVVITDIKIQGSDDFGCCKAILLNDPNAQIIISTSADNEEIKIYAQRIGIAGYVKKPVDEKVIMNVINNIFAPDLLFEQLKSFGIEIFKESLSQNITAMTKTPVSFTDCASVNAEFKAQEITSVIGIIGKYTGNMILGFSMETAGKISKLLMRREPKNSDEVLAMSAELANIIAGVACSMLNKREKALGLRVSPPSIFHGGVTQVVNPRIELQGCAVESELGQIHLWVGFRKNYDWV